MEKHLSYSEVFANWLKKRLALGLTHFTHRDILNVTGTNCSYGVLRELKLRFNFNFKESKMKSVKEFLDDKGNKIHITKQFKVYEVVQNDC